LDIYLYNRQLNIEFPGSLGGFGLAGEGRISKALEILFKKIKNKVKESLKL